MLGRKAMRLDAAIAVRGRAGERQRVLQISGGEMARRRGLWPAREAGSSLAKHGRCNEQNLPGAKK
jgi:hypothetical protein